jgi:hypothetical protein
MCTSGIPKEENDLGVMERKSLYRRSWLLLSLSIGIPVVLVIGLIWYIEASNVKYERVEDVYSGYIFGISFIAIIATLVFLYVQQVRERHDMIRRACLAILREMKENKETLTGTKFPHIMYNVNSASNNEERVNYTNAFLDLNAYESIVYSGYFTHFSVDTQHTLTILYGRVRNRNEVVKYREHYQDMFFLNDESEERVAKWYKRVERYDLFLTQLEHQIVKSLDDAELLIKKEIPL